MKILYNENGKEKVYVQLKDLAYLSGICYPMPVSIYMKMCGKSGNVLDRRDYEDFILFEKEHEIELFESLDFIIDYSEYKNLSLEQLEENAIEIAKKMLAIANTHDTCNEDMVSDHKNLEYMVNSILELHKFKSEGKDLVLPIIKDEKVFKFVGDDTYPYEMCGTIDPNAIVLYRKDGKPMNNDEIIAQAFYDMGIAIAIMEKRKVDTFIGDYSINNSLSNDKKFLIININERSYDEQQIEPQEEKSKKGMKQFVKSIFKIIK